MPKLPQFFSVNFFMFRFVVFTGCLLLAGFLSACGGTEEAKGPVIQPKKEATWVRMEKVRTTKEEVFSGDKKTLAEIPINASLAEKLATEKLDSKVVKDEVSCLNRLKLLDLRRTTIQKAGGMWHAFERNADSKPYSFNGMQLDSNTNKMIFGLRHLCQTSKGVPLNDLAIELNKLIEVHGREKTEKILIARGEHPKEVETLLDYEEFARKVSTRRIDFKMIAPRFGRAERFIDFYEELANRPVDEKSMGAFLSDSVTLLKVLNEFVQMDEIMVMALNEDAVVPFHRQDQGM